MGILDGLLNAALSGMQGGGAAPAAAPQGGGLGSMLGGGSGGPAISSALIMSVVTAVMHSQGGLGGLVSSFNNAGFGDVMKSWIGSGQNLPVSASQVSQAIGPDQLTQIAAKLGIDPAHAGGLLSQVLPHVVDQLTPQGQMPAAANQQGDLLNSALSALTGKLFSR